MPRLLSLNTKILTVLSKIKLGAIRLIKTISKPASASILFNRQLGYDGRYVISTDISNPQKAFLFDTELNTTTIINNPNSYVSNFDNFGEYIAFVKNGYLWISAATEEVLESGTLRTNIGVVYRWPVDNTSSYVTYTLPTSVAVRNDAVFGIAMDQNSSYTVISSGERNGNTIGSVGVVYVYDADMNFLRRITHPNNTQFASFGGKVLLNNNNIALISASGDVNGGKVYLYDVSNGNLLHTFNNPNIYGAATEDRFGYQIALTDTHCAISATDETDGSVKGVVYVYRLSDYSLISTILNPNINEDSNFGRSLDMSNSYIYVGAPYTIISNTSVGVIYIFSLNGTLMKTINNPVAGNGDTLFGLQHIIIKNNKLLTHTNVNYNILIFSIDESLL